MRAFSTTERSLDAECLEIRLEGELDLSVADRFQKRLDAARAKDVEVLICLEDCDFIDSTGIAVIVLAYKQIADSGRRLFVCHPSPEIRRILALTGLVEEGVIVDSTKAAPAARFGHVVSRPFREEDPTQGAALS